MLMNKLEARWRWRWRLWACLLLVGFLHCTQAALVCRPRLHQPRIYAEAQPGTYVMTFRASSEFGLTGMMYQFSDGKRNLFKMNGRTGRLTTVQKINDEIGQVYDLAVSVISGSELKYCPIKVVVTSKNQHPPKFSQKVYRVEILWTTPLRMSLINVETSDDDIEDYNKEVYYFLSNVTKEDHDQASTTWPSVDTSAELWMNSELDLEVEQNVSSSFRGNSTLFHDDRYLSIDRRTGVVYLNRQLDRTIGRITAEILAVDGGSPAISSTASLEVIVNSIGMPINVTTDNISENSVRVCWKGSPVGLDRIKGYVILYKAITSSLSLLQNQTLKHNTSLTDKESCIYINELYSATDYELWLYGFSDEMQGLSSEKYYFRTITQRCSSKGLCNNGTCFPNVTISNGNELRNYTCVCQDGFYGENCQHRNSCALGLVKCNNGGSCVALPKGIARCNCPSPYFGQNCDESDEYIPQRAEVDEKKKCVKNGEDGLNCQNGGSCATLNNGEALCICVNPFVGDYCEYEPTTQCNLECDENQVCVINRANGTQCVCKDGFVAVGVECKVDPCKQKKCRANERCVALDENIAHCHCPTRVEGDQCLSKEKYCPLDCLHGGNCTLMNNIPRCKCPKEYSGSKCEFKVCLEKCQNNGSCVNGSCVCSPGYNGDYCQNQISSTNKFCDSWTCLNGGKCKENVTELLCTCSRDFKGNRCQFKNNCSEEWIRDERGDYHFESVAAGTHLIRKCHFGPFGETVRRLCQSKNDSNAVWGPFDHSKCNISNIRVIATNMTTFTQNATEFGRKEVQNTTDTIKQLLELSINDSTLANTTFVAISNLLDADQMAFKDDESNYTVSDRLIDMIDTFVGNVELEDGKDNVEIKTDNLLVKVQLVRAEKNKKLPDMTFEGLSSDDKEVPVANITAAVLNQAMQKLNSDVRVHFIAHKNAKLFRERWSLNESDSRMATALDRSTLVSRPVLTISLGNFPVNNITNAVNFNLKKPLTGSWLCAYWVNNQSKWSIEGMTTSQDDKQVTCSASHMTSFSILLDPNPDVNPTDIKAMSIISYVGSGLSVLGLILTILTYSLFRCLNRDRSGKILLNLCVSMLLLNVSFLSGAFQSDFLKKSGEVVNLTDSATEETVKKNPLCTTVAVFTHYFLLTTMAWMTVEAINMYQLLIYVFATSETRFLLKRCFVAWGVPAVVVGITAAVNSSYYNPTNEYCMLSPVNPYVYYITLITPCCLLLLINTIVFVMVTRVLFQPRRNSNKSNKSMTTKPHVTFAQVRGAFTVMTLLGISWIFGALAIGQVKIIFQYIFCICNSLQGFLLFIVRCLQYPQAQQAWLQLVRTGTLKKHRGPKLTNTVSNSSGNSNNTQVKLTLSNATSTTTSTLTTNGGHHQRHLVQKPTEHVETRLSRSVESLNLDQIN
ncbi:hypothetical protein CHUAL_000214 [Chamberlinius hualienensis]